MNKINERLDENSGVTQNTFSTTYNEKVIKVNQKDSEGIGFGQLVPIKRDKNVAIFVRAEKDVIIKVYNPNTKELIFTIEDIYINSFRYAKYSIHIHKVRDIDNIFIAFTIKDIPTDSFSNNTIYDLRVIDESTFLKKKEILTKTNAEEYVPTRDYNPATKKYVDDKVPHYNETLMFEISGEDFGYLMNNNYFNINALNIDETNSYVGKVKMDINSDEEFICKFVYDKTNNALIDEISRTYIYNHKSYDGTNFTEDENSSVITLGITTFGTGGGPVEAEVYFRLYEVEKLELNNNCLPDNVSIKNSLTVGSRIGDIGEFSVSEGDEITASGVCSHAEGSYTEASGNVSHAEGGNTTASGVCSHAEGSYTEASGYASHAEGNETIASSRNQHVQGKYNINDTENKYAHIVGNGEADTARSNAHTLDWNGNAWYQGKLSQDGVPTEDKDLATKKYVDDTIANQPIFSFNNSGELVVTINGVSKTFVPKTE